MHAGQCSVVYQEYLLDFMGCCDGILYKKGKIFEEDQLVEVVPPEDFLHWMKLCTFGVPDLVVLPEGQEFLIRSVTLEVMKKTFSWYMPDQVAAWNVWSRMGNPTRSKDVDKSI